MKKKLSTILQRIEENLERLDEKIGETTDRLIKDNKKIQQPYAETPLDTAMLLSMPEHLRKTALTLFRFRRATADKIALHTKRARLVESAYLNQLVILGYLKKERKGRRAYFFVNEENQN